MPTYSPLFMFQATLWVNNNSHCTLLSKNTPNPTCTTWPNPLTTRPLRSTTKLYPVTTSSFSNRTTRSTTTTFRWTKTTCSTSTASRSYNRPTTRYVIYNCSCCTSSTTRNRSSTTSSTSRPKKLICTGTRNCTPIMQARLWIQSMS